MSNFQPINPKPFLKSLIGKRIIVRLKWNKTEYKGILVSIDNYMNLQMDQTYEIIHNDHHHQQQQQQNDDDEQRGNDNEVKEELIGEIFIRCNNVLFIREAKDQDPVQEQVQEQTETKEEEVVIEKEEVKEVVMEEAES